MSSLPLTYVPIIPSLHVYLNGLEVQRDQWTYDPVTNKIDTLTAAGDISGDRLEARYAHNGDTVVIPAPVFIDSNEMTVFTNTAFSVPLPVSTAAGHALFVGIHSDAGLTTPAGWTKILPAVNILAGFSGFPSFLHVYRKVAIASEPNPSFTPDGTSWTAAVSAAYGNAAYLSSTSNIGAAGLSHVTPAVADGELAVHLWAIDRPIVSTPATATLRRSVEAGGAYAVMLADIEGSLAGQSASAAQSCVWGGVSIGMAGSL